MPDASQLAGHQSVCISAVIPACQRLEELSRTLRRIDDCRPPPSEIIVHADGGSVDTIYPLTLGFPNVRFLSSNALLGPGGSRDKLIRAAKNSWVATFDDDSHPVDLDYFGRIAEVTAQFPNTSVFSAVTVHNSASGEESAPDLSPGEVFVFSGCGCVFNKDWYERTRGYVPIPVAYGMEEVDLSLQLYALGGVILEIPQLRVFHKAPYAKPPSHDVLAYSLANIALLAFLRFPVVLWPLVPLQLLSRFIWAVRQGWTAGLWQGLRLIPGHLRKYAQYRAPLPVVNVVSWLWQRHFPVTPT